MVKSVIKYVAMGSVALYTLGAIFVTPAHATAKVALCHKEGHTYEHIEVSVSAKAAHLLHGDFLYDGGSNWNDYWKNKWCNDNRPTPTPTARPTKTPSSTPSPTASPSVTPTATPVVTASPTATASATPSVSPTATPDPTESPRTDLSDGRSDGKTDSLGCQKPSDNCNPAGIGGGSELPSTGGTPSAWFLIIPGLAATLGAWMVWSTYKKESSSKSQTQ